MLIKFGRKFTAKNFEDIVGAYWKASRDSKKTDVIFFDLQEIEWIAVEEITFLFGWFRFLILNDHKIKVLLPSFHSDFKTHNQLINLWGKWKIYSFMDLVGHNASLMDYFNIDNSVNQIIDNQIAKEYFKQEDVAEDITVVPFQHVSTYGYGNVTSIDDFVINKIHKPLNLAKQVYDVLEQHTNISSKDNMLLSRIVTNELFLNVLHHSFQTNGDDFEECFFAISLKRKISLSNIIKTETLKRIFDRQKNTNENYQEAKKNIEPVTSEEASTRLNYILSTVIPKGYESERISETLDFFKNLNDDEFPYKNQDYIEFSFLDFGQGIPRSLKDSYLKDISNELLQSKVVSELHSLHFSQHLDTRILEYAFLLNSSRHPFELEMQIDFEIPRGLYYLIDIVRRHSGLVTARSRNGKIIYDFSKPVKHIKDAVIYSNQDSSLADFEGTLISVTIPASQDFTALQGGANPPYAMPDLIKSRPSYYYSMVELMSEIQVDHGNESKLTLQNLYKLFFDRINKVFDVHNGSPCLIIFDCIGFDIFPIKHKLLYYFCTSPNVNRQTSVVILNFFDLDILTHVRDSIRYKLKNSLGANYVFKPVPIINSDDDIIWIGVDNDNDELKLTELLRYEDHFITKSDLLNFDNYKGIFFDIDKFGNITTKIPTHEKITKLARDNDKGK